MNKKLDRVISLASVCIPLETKITTSKFQEFNINYEPGDSFSLICPNDSDEVELLLRR